VDLFTDAIGKVGFPIAMCIYLLLKFEARLQEISNCVKELRLLIGQIRDELRGSI